MLRQALCCAALLAALSGEVHAGADDFDRVVSFGDSLSDNGNLDAATLGLLPGADYFAGRFSNGPTFVELLAGTADFASGASSQQQFWGPGFLLNPAPVTGDVNLAIGGATAEGGIIPSVEVQIQAFQAAGGQFGTNDLVTLLAGANDIFNADLDAGVAADAAEAQSRNVAALIAAGARTIVVASLPNLGATPDFNVDPLTAEAGLIATNTFNGALDTNVEALAAANPQANLVQANLQGVLDIVIANPEAFGFTNVTQACLGSGAGGGVCANPNQFLFFDGVHPTAAGHAFLAEFIDILLSTDETGAAVAPLGEMAVAERLEASDILFRRAVPLMGSGAPGGAYAEIVGQSANGAGGGAGFDYQLAGVRVGFDARHGAFIFGAALAYLEGDVGGRGLAADTTTTQADAYALYQFAPFFIGVEAGASFTSFDDIRRDTGFPTLIGESETDSAAYTIAATLGTHIDMGAIRLTPAIRAGYLSANVDAFDETVPLLALGFSDREIDAGFWTARLRASAYLDRARRFQGFVEGGYEDLFSVEDGFSAKLIDNTAQAVAISPDVIEARGFFLNAGVSADLGGARLAGEYGISFREDDGDVHTGRVSLTIPLGGAGESLK